MEFADVTPAQITVAIVAVAVAGLLFRHFIWKRLGERRKLDLRLGRCARAHAVFTSGAASRISTTRAHTSLLL